MDKEKKSKQPLKKRPMIEKKGQFSIWYIIFAFLFLYIFQSYMMRSQVEKITYSEFKSFVRDGKVLGCTLSADKIDGVYFLGDTTELKDIKAAFLSLKNEMKAKNPNAKTSLQEWIKIKSKQDPKFKTQFVIFSTHRVDDPKLVEELEASGVEFTGVAGPSWVKSLFIGWILPMAILFAIWGIILRRMSPSGGMMSIGKSKAKVYVEGETKVTFKDVAGVDEAVEEVSEIVEFLKKPSKFQSLGGRIPKGVLLVGPPGTGKTLLAKAVAGEAKVPFFSMSGSDFVEMFVGVGAARVRDLFQQASQKAPCIIFIDELDALGKARGIGPTAGHDEREQTLNQLLAEMDGFDSNAGVIIMAATNRPEILDIALLRPGRFDRQIVVDRPDINGREAILNVHAKKVKLSKDIDLRVIAARTPGFVGADLANVINEAALLAARRNKKTIGMEELEEAIDRVIAGLERKSRVMNKSEKERVAYHESGHAIVATTTEGCDPVHRVSIIPRGVAALGYTLQLPAEDRYLMTKKELEAKLKVLLGGRVAEELKYNEISTGAQNDLEQATNIARSMVVEYGMSERIGPVAYGRGNRNIFLGTEFQERKVYSESLAAEIDQEVKRIISEAYQEVHKILSKRMDKLEQLAQRLLEKEVIEKEELEEIMGDSLADGE